VREKQDAYNSLTQNIKGFKSCNLAEKLDEILTRMPQKKPHYLAFVNSNRRLGQHASENDAADIGQRRRGLINRPMSKDDGQSLVPAKKPPQRERPFDPDFAFIYTGGSKSLATYMKRKTQHYHMLEAAKGEAAEALSSEYQVELGEEEPETIPEEEMEQDQEQEVETPSAPNSEESVLKDALSMPVVQWQDPD